MTSTLMFFICSVRSSCLWIRYSYYPSVASALDPNPVHDHNMGTFMTRGSKICLLAEPVDKFSLFSN